MATTAGSFALARSMRPADAPLAARLRAAGAIILGKGNLSEWANFRSTRSSSGWSGIGGQTRNAYSPLRNPSGSSAGSAVAAAASFCAAAIGTETNGSILSPSSLNGLVGLKPTVGLVSGKGVVPISHRQDTAGPMCRTVADAALLAAAMAERPLGFGAHGSDIEAFRLKGVRVGALPLPKGIHPGTERLFSDARAVLAQEGAVIVDLKAPAAFDEADGPEFEALMFEFKAAINEYLATLDPSQVEARTLAELIEFNRAHADQELVVFGQEIFEMSEAHGPLDDPAYQKALATLTRASDVEGLATLLGHEGVEVLLSPSNGPADLIDHVWGDRRGGGWSQIANAAAIAGYPSLTVPAGLVSDLPVGITLVAARNQDGLLLQVARAFERASGRTRRAASHGLTPAEPAMRARFDLGADAHASPRHGRACAAAFALAAALAVGPALGSAAEYTLLAKPETVAWGYYSGEAKPVLSVHSGDTVRMQTLSTCGSPERLMSRGVKRQEIPAYTDAIYQEVKDRGPGGHILTGPVAIAEAEPGDVLEVDILKIDIDVDFACNSFGVGRGFLPMEYPYRRTKIIPLDRGRMLARFAPGIEIPLHPFFGSMGVAPEGGKIDSAPPFAHAGNLDNKELMAGTTLYIPVAAKGALFEAGDCHAGQGNAEVDITELDTYLTGTFRFVVHKDRHLIWPRAETPTYYISMGFSKDLGEATRHAVRDTIAFLMEEKHLSRDDAYMLTSVAVDVDITQLVDGNVGVHTLLPKKIFTSAPR